jgi:hypothetical protein
VNCNGGFPPELGRHGRPRRRLAGAAHRPRQRAVWVRIGGRWRKGRILEWVIEQGAPGWDCVILANEPPGNSCRGKAAMPSTRRRDSDAPPPGPWVTPPSGPAGRPARP